MVSAIGKDTEAGKIAQLLSKKSKAKIPLLEKMEKLSFTISIVIGIMVVILFAIGLLKGMTFYALFLFKSSEQGIIHLPHWVSFLWPWATHKLQ